MSDNRKEYFEELLRENPDLIESLKPRLNKFIPQTPTAKQAAFLAVRNKLEVLFGGAAAGGKSSALLMAALEYVDEPDYSALILRRTFAQLNMPDSILDRAKKWLNPWFAQRDVKWREKDSRFEFKSGAKVQFGYTQYDADVTQYDSASYHFIGFDETTQFSEYQFTFMAGRLRRLVGSKIPLRLRGATNPGGVGHLWVKKRFVTYRGPDRLFIPAKLTDNPHADQESYIKSLQLLDPITRAQRWLGDWDVSSEGTLFKREWFKDFITPQPICIRRVRYWDLAATVDGGDWLVGTLMSVDINGKFYVEHVHRSQPGPHVLYDTIKQIAQIDGPNTAIRIEQEGGASGKVVIADLVLMLTGYDVKGEPAMKSKIVRWQPFARVCEAGRVVIKTGTWNEDWIDEICQVPSAEHDDQADSASGAFKYLAIDAPSAFGVDRVILDRTQGQSVIPRRRLTPGRFNR